MSNIKDLQKFLEEIGDTEETPEEKPDETPEEAPEEKPADKAIAKDKSQKTEADIEAWLGDKSATLDKRISSTFVSKLKQNIEKVSRTIYKEFVDEMGEASGDEKELVGYVTEWVQMTLMDKLKS